MNCLALLSDESFITTEGLKIPEYDNEEEISLESIDIRKGIKNIIEWIKQKIRKLMIYI